MMSEEKKRLLNELHHLKRQRDGKKKRMMFLEQNCKEVAEYKKHQDDLGKLQEQIAQTIQTIQFDCKHTWFQVGFEYDKLLNTNNWQLKCLKCGKESTYYQYENLEEKPKSDIIYQDCGLDFEGAKETFINLEEIYGEDKASQMVLSLSKNFKKY